MKNDKINTDGVFQTMMIIWGSLAVSQLFFPVIVFGAKPELFRFDRTPLFGGYAVEIGFLGFVSLVSLVTSFTLRKRFNNQAVATQNVGLVQTAMIFGCAMCEVISLFGIFVAFVFDFQYFFAFSALGIIGTLLHFPRRTDIQAAGYKT
ncbi:MAG: hypothetical protein WBC19_08115 [Pyrinomonadaceae bacterium]|nr:hypothetical protein [Chloracidobacterium sp.]